MLSLEEAVARVAAGVAPLPVERVPLDTALGRVLATDVAARVDLPPWDNAAMDGYAVRADDVRGATEDAPVMLRVRETVAAGGEPPAALRPGEAVRIMTGAPVPRGCETVVRLEDTDGGTESVRIRSARDVGRNVRERGQDLRAGTVAVSSGTRLRPAHLGLLAAAGAATIPVHRRPRVLLLCSGDELVELDRYEEVLAGRRIVSANGYTLRALAAASGAEVVDAGIVPDDPDAWAGALEDADRYDLVLSAGGASVGEFDLARQAAERRGAHVDFWRVRVRPASQTAFARLGATRWLVLPGNPVSAMVGFELFARPLLRLLAGDTRPWRAPVAVQLGEPIGTPGGATFLLRVRLTEGGGDLPVAHLTGPQGTGLLSSMARADALLVVPESTPMLDAGTVGSALPLHGECTSPRFSLQATHA